MSMTLKEIKELKKQLGLTNAQLSDLSGVPLSTVQKVLGNTTSAPRNRTLRKLEEALIGSRSGRAFSDPEVEIPPSVHGIQEFTEKERSAGSASCAQIPDPDLSGSDASIAGYTGYRRDTDGILLGEPPAPYQTDSSSGGIHTLKDYYELPKERRAELIDGVFYDMAAPGGIHQDILLILGSLFREHIRKNKGGCKVYVAPRDVQLDPQDEKTIVQPDVLVVCDRKKITERCILGAPDFIAEILSPSTREKDLHLKAAKYSGAGVREYWIIDPEKGIILVYRFTESRFPACFSFADSISVGIWDDRLQIDFSSIREEISDLYE